MSTSLENACETLAVLLLRANAELVAAIGSVNIVRQDEDTGADKDRVVCKAATREVERNGLNLAQVVTWRVPVDIKVYLVTRDAAEYDTVIAMIQRSLNTRSIASNSVANPTVVTTTLPHNLTTGDSITIANSSSTPTINGVRVATVISATTFSVPVNVTGAGSTGSFLGTAAVTQATAWGVGQIEDTDEGDKETQDNLRSRTKRFNFLAQPV